MIREALSHAGEDQQLVNRLSLLEERRITPGRVLPPMQFLFRLFGKPCFPRGELVGVTGKPKSGKTFVSTILMMLCFIDNLLEMGRASPEPLRVLWLDTEQSDESTQDILLNRMMPMLKRYFPPEKHDEIGRLLFGEEGSFFHIFNVRQDPWQERMPLLEAAVERYGPDLVIVDGIRDLINDINDGVLAQETVERLMHLAAEKHCCMVCILHQNKSAEDKNLRGWIGTELTHKAFEVYVCEKSDARIFSFRQQLTRKYDISEVMKYVTDEQGIPQLAAIEALTAGNECSWQQGGEVCAPSYRDFVREWVEGKPEFDLPRVFAYVMPEEGQAMPGSELRCKVMNLLHLTSPNYYNTLCNRAVEQGIIVRDRARTGHVFYHRPVLQAGNGERQEMVQGRLFGDDAGDDPGVLPTFDQMGEGPVDDLPF